MNAAAERAERAILDTTLIIATAVAPIPCVLAISAVSLAELHFGVMVAKTREIRRVMDLLIAATAHAYGAKLYTRNPDDFAGLDDLVGVVPV